MRTAARFGTVAGASLMMLIIGCVRVDFQEYQLGDAQIQDLGPRGPYPRYRVLFDEAIPANDASHRFLVPDLPPAEYGVFLVVEVAGEGFTDSEEWRILWRPTDRRIQARLTVESQDDGSTLFQDGGYFFEAWHTGYDHDSRWFAFRLPWKEAPSLAGNTRFLLEIDVDGETSFPEDLVFKLRLYGGGIEK